MTVRHNHQTIGEPARPSKINLPNNVLSIYCTITIKTSITNHDITASVSFTHKHALKCYALAEEHYDYFMAFPYVKIMWKS